MAACAEHAPLSVFRGGGLWSVKTAFAAACVLAVLPLLAAQEHVVDVAALVAAQGAGLAETNGWTMSGLASYPDGCLKFDTRGDTLLSPAYSAPVLRLEARVRCSSTTPTRWLYVLDAETGVTNGTFAACVKKDTLEAQTLTFAATADVRRLRFLLEGSANTGVWGFGALTVVTADPVSAPSGLALERATATQATVVWTNGANCVSNRIDLYSATVTAEEEPLFTCGFDNFMTDGKGNPVSYDARMLLENEPLWGVNVYAPTNFPSGICQIGTGEKVGALYHPGFEDCMGLALRLVARRYPGDNAETHVSYLVGDETNVVATLVLSDVFEDLMIDLSSVPANVPIRIGFAGTTKTDRRVWVDRLSFVRAKGEVRVPVASDTIAAGTGPVRFSTRALMPLRPESRWALEVRCVSSEGVVSAPVGLTFGTHPSGGMAWLIQ